MAHQRNKRGTVGIETKQGKLRLRLPRTIAEVNARYISTFLDDTPENRRKVQVKAWEIETDIQNGELDPTLSKYTFNKVSSSVVVTKATKAIPDLRELWQAYCEYRKPVVAITTYRTQYLGYINNQINKLPSRSLNDATDIRNYLVNRLSVDSARRVLTQINACCEWALKVGLIINNPFVGMTREFKQAWNTTDIDPFSVDERDAILLAYSGHPRYKYYYPFIQFLFFVGCRPGEACGLKWKHISTEHILFTETWNARHHITKETKTGNSRRFPTNKQTREVLNSVKPVSYSPEAYVFTTRHDFPINNEKIPRLLGWKLIVESLVDEGKVKRYRTPYNCRHTFITLALEAGLTVPQVAALVGNTPQTLLKHYAGSQVTDVPLL